MFYSPAGAHESGLIGEDPVGRPGNLLPLLGQMAVGRVKDPVLKVFGNDYPTQYDAIFLLFRHLLKSVTSDGTCVRDYIHIMDLAGGHLNALDAISDESLSKTFGNAPELDVNFKGYNLGKGRGQSVFDIVAAMTRASGYEYKTEIIGRRCARTRCRFLLPTLTYSWYLAFQYGRRTRPDR